MKFYKPYFIALFIIGISFVYACNSNSQELVSDQEQKNHEGKELYERFCKTCHGSSGNLGLSGAANLQISVLPQEEAIQVITNGRNVMVGFKGMISNEDIVKISDYILTLRIEN